VPGVEGGSRSISRTASRRRFRAAESYRAEGVPLILIVGKEYGSGSIARLAARDRSFGRQGSYRRELRTDPSENLVGMGVLALEFMKGQNRESLGLTGREVYSIRGFGGRLKPRQTLKVRAEDSAR